MSYICAYCDDEFSDNVMCPECVNYDDFIQKGLRKDLSDMEQAYDAAETALAAAEVERKRLIGLWSATEGLTESMHENSLRYIAERDEFKARLATAMEALESAEEALTQAFVDEANCDGLHVMKGHHGPRAKKDCFELWASIPAHQAALDKIRAILEPVEPK